MILEKLEYEGIPVLVFVPVTIVNPKLRSDGYVVIQPGLVTTAGINHLANLSVI